MKKGLFLLAIFALSISFASASSDIYDINQTGYTTTAYNHIGFPIVVEFTVHRISSWFGVNEYANITLDVLPQGSSSYIDSFANTFGCGSTYPCHVELVGHYLVSVNMNESEYTHFNERIVLLEQNISELKERVSLLESWKQTIVTTISNIWLAITGNTDRIEALEDAVNEEPNVTLPDYWKYLSDQERKSIACGYAEDKSLTTIEMLGWSCDLVSNGKKVNCKCSKIEI